MWNSAVEAYPGLIIRNCVNGIAAMHHSVLEIGSCSLEGRGPAAGGLAVDVQQSFVYMYNCDVRDFSFRYRCRGSSVCISPPASWNNVPASVGKPSSSRI